MAFPIIWHFGTYATPKIRFRVSRNPFLINSLCAVGTFGTFGTLFFVPKCHGSGPRYCASMPPSILNSEPVTNLLSSDARYSTQ
jgi:hypothetical protein